MLLNVSMFSYLKEASFKYQFTLFEIIAESVLRIYSFDEGFLNITIVRKL